MARKLYLECETGISGDMLAAALLDAGADQQHLLQVLEGIGDDGFHVAIRRVQKAGIDCCDFDVILDAEHENHDHDMQYLYGHEHEHSHEHMHEHDHEHAHGHAHVHRNLKDVYHIIEKLNMTARAKEYAMKTFSILAESEAKAHNKPIEEVHFHEVGAIDSIVDIVSAAVCLDDLHVDGVIITGLTEGCGTVRCQHGILPVPVPAVANIAAAYGLPLKITERKGELVTPTGAAFAAAVMTSMTLPKQMRMLSVGYGAGKREYDRPSMVRAMVIEELEEQKQTSADMIWKLETDIDDCTGEQLGYTMECLYAAGAREVHYTPVYMKKNRPGWELTVITDEEHEALMEEILFRETTTIGIRKTKMERSVLIRQIDQVETPFGKIEVKFSADTAGKIKKAVPEYESVKMAAKTKDMSFQTVYRAAAAAAEQSDK